MVDIAEAIKLAQGSLEPGSFAAGINALSIQTVYCQRAQARSRHTGRMARAWNGYYLGVYQHEDSERLIGLSRNNTNGRWCMSAVLANDEHYTCEFDSFRKGISTANGIIIDKGRLPSED